MGYLTITPQPARHTSTSLVKSTVRQVYWWKTQDWTGILSDKMLVKISYLLSGVLSSTWPSITVCWLQRDCTIMYKPSLSGMQQSWDHQTQADMSSPDTSSAMNPSQLFMQLSFCNSQLPTIWFFTGQGPQPQIHTIGNWFKIRTWKRWHYYDS